MWALQLAWRATWWAGRRWTTNTQGQQRPAPGHEGGHSDGDYYYDPHHDDDVMIMMTSSIMIMVTMVNVTNSVEILGDYDDCHDNDDREDDK